MLLCDNEAAALRPLNNPQSAPTGHFTGRCMRCGSSSLWDDNTAYGCDCCGAWWTGFEPLLIPDDGPYLQSQENRMLTRTLIRTDGTSEALPPGMSLRTIRELISAETLDTVALHHMGEPLHVMLVDDAGYEVEMIQHSPTHFERRPTRARKPLNAEATRLYHLNCRPGTRHQIVGDVVVVPDVDFA